MSIITPIVNIKVLSVNYTGDLSSDISNFWWLKFQGQLPDPCEFGQWQSWSDCSTSCGEGYRSRLRSVANLADAGGAQCNGLLSEVTGCHAGY